MNDPIKNQINIIEDLISLGRKQVSIIDGKGKNPLYISRAQQVATILSVENIYTEVFWNIIDFLKNKLESEKDEYFSYYYPLTRTLTEIYVELVYFVQQDDNKKYAISVTQYLFQLSKRYIDTSKQNSNELKTLYSSYYKNFKAKSLKLPQNIQDFSKGYLNKSGFNFPKIEQIIKNYIDLKNIAPITKTIFPALTKKKIYNLHYRIQSDYLHGQIYSLIKIDKSQNEKFWIIAQCQVISFLFLELVDRKILNEETKNQFNEIINKFKKDNSDFVKLWKVKKHYDKKYKQNTKQQCRHQNSHF